MKRFLLIMAALLVACATPLELKSPQEIASAVKVKSTAFDKNITYVGPAVPVSPENNEPQYGLAALRNKNTEFTRYHMIVNIIYTGDDWRSYDSASFTNALTVNASTLDDDVFCGDYDCEYLERLVIPLTKAFLDRKADTGFIVRLNSQSGEQTFVKVPPNYIQGFMRKVGSAQI